MLQLSTKLYSAITHITTFKTGDADIQFLHSGKFLQKLHTTKKNTLYSSQSDKIYHLYGLMFNPLFVFYKVSCTLFLFHKTWIRHNRNESTGILYAVQFTCVSYSKPLYNRECYACYITFIDWMTSETQYAKLSRYLYMESKGFWRWRITIRNRFTDFAHCLVF
jgi:hypothetical protein